MKSIKLDKGDFEGNFMFVRLLIEHFWTISLVSLKGLPS